MACTKSLLISHQTTKYIFNMHVFMRDKAEHRIKLLYQLFIIISYIKLCLFQLLIGASTNPRATEEIPEDVLVSDGLLLWLNWRLLLLSFSGWRDARRENSRKTSTREMSPVTGDTRVRMEFVQRSAGHPGD